MTSEPAPMARPSREMAVRIASAAVLIPIVLAATILGRWSFTVLVVCSAFILCWEWATLVRSTTRVREPTFLAHFAAVASAAILWTGGFYLAAIAALMAGAVATTLLTATPKRLMATFGVLYIGIPALALIWLRSDPIAGFQAVFYVLAVVWSADSGALMFGRAIGGPRFSRRISPNKTWAGMIGGLVTGVAASVLFVHALNVQAIVDVWPGAVLIGGLIAVATLAGDLIESAIKRQFGVKDISGMIPGHGGLLDRVDGLLLAAVVAALIAVMRTNSDAFSDGVSMPLGNGPGAGVLFWPGL